MPAPPEIEPLLVRLETMPSRLQAAADSLDRACWRNPPPGGGFSLVEHSWHLADLEREGYGRRIERLLREDAPFLPDFQGDLIAGERAYRTRSLEEGLAAFAAAREANLKLLRAQGPEAWERSGTQEGIGPVALRDIPRLMAEHDDSHRAEIDALLAPT